MGSRGGGAALRVEGVLGLLVQGLGLGSGGVVMGRGRGGVFVGVKEGRIWIWRRFGRIRRAGNYSDRTSGWAP